MIKLVLITFMVDLFKQNFNTYTNYYIIIKSQIYQTRFLDIDEDKLLQYLHILSCWFHHSNHHTK